MNEDQLRGEGRDITGKVKETVGDVTGDPALQSEGLVDQISGKLQKVVGAARNAVDGEQPAIIGKARTFMRDRPFAAAALAGVVGLAILNTLRGKR